MRSWPALEVRGPDPDLVVALVDDFSPTAIDEHDAATRVFFASADRRDAARDALARDGHVVAAVDVLDEDWARRSQENLAPVAVGRLVIASTPESRPAPEPRIPNFITIVIRPSMGFGTGHHASTRLCLLGLQRLDVTGRRVLDVGTGSGILAIAAARLGAADALGIDYDGDAIAAAVDNLPLNPGLPQVRFEQADLTTATLPRADIVTANLTTTALVAHGAALAGVVAPGGTLLVSGVLSDEQETVRARFAGAELVWADEQDGWAGLAFRIV